MASVNKVTLIGNLGRDPELRYTQSNKPVCTLSVATNERWKDRQTGEWKENTEWHKVICWKALAERIAEKCSKGSEVYVEGKLQTRKWEKDGIERYTTEIVAAQVQVLGGQREQQPEQPPEPQDDDSGLPF